MPSDRINPNRLWTTSSLIPFLGHIALERLHCGKDGSQVRVIVNGSPQRLPDCHHGLHGACPLHDFEAWMKEREERYGHFEEVCGVEKQSN